MENNDFEFNSFMIKNFRPNDKKVGLERKQVKYHYTSPEAFLSIIKNKTIRFTDIRYMNDKSETIYFLKVLLEFVENRKMEFPLFFELVNEVLKEIDNASLKNLTLTNYSLKSPEKLPYKLNRSFVFCLSGSPDSLNMWNYYVHNGNYQGYNIGFNIAKLLRTFDVPDEVIDGFIVYYGRVLYSKVDQYREIEHLASKTEKYLNNSEGLSSFDYAQIELIHYIDSYSAFYKDESFKSEHEYRIVIQITDERIPHNITEAGKYVGKNNKSMYEDFCSKKGLIVPFLNVKIPDNAIETITISPITEAEIAEKSVSELLRISGFNIAEIVKSKIPIRF